MPHLVMTREELRVYLVNGIDRILSVRPIFSGLTQTDREVLGAQRKLYLNDDDVLDRLLSILAQERRTSEQPEQT